MSAEPTIIFLYDLKQWYQNISPLSKIDIMDIAPSVSSQFFFDYKIQSYVMILSKSKWDVTAPETKKKFMIVSRRVKEEMEGPLSSVKREEYENSDIFELFMAAQKKQEEPVEEKKEMPPIDEESVSENVTPCSSDEEYEYEDV